MNTNAYGTTDGSGSGLRTTSANALFYDNVVLSLIASAPAGEWISTKYNGPSRPLLPYQQRGHALDAE